ncbi:MAG: hypothetical protein M1814_001121 [Vezdaea aestivalis]|nr:MAG: hypothetical protein M1814_001121 [Vezdaea aestivalis]
MIVPETIHVHVPLPHILNSIFPVLVYRSALVSSAQETTTASVRKQFEPNGWHWQGTFKAYYGHHFHSVTHECYVVLKGSSVLSLGAKKGVGSVSGEDYHVVEVEVKAGDAIVLPAGVAHSSLTASPDYEYVGLYPNGSPPYDTNWCEAGVQETLQIGESARGVPVPISDPINGARGPLMSIWRAALS